MRSIEVRRLMMPSWDELFKAGKFSQRQPTRAVVEFAERLRERGLRRVLDIGCGAGRHLLFLAEQGFEAHGLDISTVGLSYAHRRLQDEGLWVGLVRGDMARLPYKSGSFDAAIAIASLYHSTLEGMRWTIAELYRVLRPGGLALLEFKSKKSFRYGKGEEIEPDTFIAETGTDAGIPHHYSNREEIEELLGGFAVHRLLEKVKTFDEGHLSGRWEVWVEKPF